MEYVDGEHFRKEYNLTAQTIERIELLKEELKENVSRANSTWQIIGGEKVEEISTDDEESASDREADDNNDVIPESTQFYFTQVVGSSGKAESVPSCAPKNDIVECLCEGLERNNGKFDVAQLKVLSDDELVEVMRELQNRLSSTGIYNLCCSMNSMDLDQRMKYSPVLCSQCLLPRVIALKEPSRLLSAAIAKCVEKCPDDMQKFIFVPLLNVDLSDSTVINAIVNNFDPRRKATLVMDFLTSVKELRAWHIPVLQNLLPLETDHNASDKLLRLFLDGAVNLAKDRNFGKLMLSYLKLNADFSKEQKDLLRQIVTINETIFKKPMENILNSL